MPRRQELQDLALGNVGSDLPVPAQPNDPVAHEMNAFLEQPAIGSASQAMGTPADHDHRLAAVR